MSTNPNLNELIVLEYSVSQNAFHRETVRDMVCANIRAAAEKRSSDFTVLGIFETQAEADEAFERIEPILKPKKASAGKYY